MAEEMNWPNGLEQPPSVSGSQHDRLVMCVCTPGGVDYARLVERLQKDICEVLIVPSDWLGSSEQLEDIGLMETMIMTKPIIEWPPGMPSIDKRPYWRRFEKYGRT